MSAAAQAPVTTGWCTFTVAGRRCGIEVTRVQEVLRAAAITPLPLAPPAVRGLLNLRGRIVPAVDLRHVLDLPPAEAGASAGHLIVFDGGSPVSLVVDAIGDVPRRRRAWCRCRTRSPARLATSSRARVPLADGLLLVLDLDRTLDRAFAAPDASRTPARPAAGQA